MDSRKVSFTPRRSTPVDIKRCFSLLLFRFFIDKIFTIVECICVYKSEMGKLQITDKFIKFRSLRYIVGIPLDNDNILS